MKVKCIQKIRNKRNQIIGYKLQDLQGNTRDIKSNGLKQAMFKDKVEVINLKLTVDNRLIDKKIENNSREIEIEYVTITREMIEKIGEKK